MKNSFAVLSPFLLVTLALAGGQASGCNGSLDASPADAGPAFDAGAPVGRDSSTLPPVPVSDAAVVSCSVAKGEDYVDLCLQKQILLAEHAVFDPKLGMPSSWDSRTGVPDADAGTVLHDVRDDLAYAASLTLYAISARTYGDTEISSTVLAPDLAALATLVRAELATLPASYDGELYMRLRRFADGLRIFNDPADGAAIDALADAYGKAIYTSFFHPLTPGPAGGTDAGGLDVDAGDDAGSVPDAGDASASDAASPPPLANDGILGVPAVAGSTTAILYDVDQAASGALALIDLAARAPATDAGVGPTAWARAAASTMNHLYARARHPSGLYYTDLVTSGDAAHDALAPLSAPNDALRSATAASVGESLLRMSAIVQKAGLASVGSFPFADQAVSPLSGLQGVAPAEATGVSLWDSTPTEDTTASCSRLADAASCGGSGFFVRYLPSSTGLDNTVKEIRGNALAFGAIHRSLVTPGTAAGLDVLPLTALFESQAGVNASFLSATGAINQSSYTDAVSAGLTVIPGRSSFSAQADAYAIEALTEQWIGRSDCPSEFY